MIADNGDQFMLFASLVVFSIAIMKESVRRTILQQLSDHVNIPASIERKPRRKDMIGITCNIDLAYYPSYYVQS